METKRLKNVIICFLLVVNAVLLAVIYVHDAEERAAERAMLEGTRAALASLNCTVADGVLETAHIPLYTLEEERVAARERAFYVALVGGEHASDNADGSYTVNGSLGNVSVTAAGTFEVHFNADVDIDDIETLFRNADATYDERYGGVSIFGRTVRAERNTLTGSVLVGETYIVGGTPSKSVQSALFSLAGLLGGGKPYTVLAVRQGYVAKPLARGYQTLKPVWRIETTLGDYLLDAITGEQE